VIPFFFERRAATPIASTKKVQTERHRTGCAGAIELDDEVHCVIGQLRGERLVVRSDQSVIIHKRRAAILRSMALQFRSFAGRSLDSAAAVSRTLRRRLAAFLWSGRQWTLSVRALASHARPSEKAILSALLVFSEPDLTPKRVSPSGHHTFPPDRRSRDRRTHARGGRGGDCQAIDQG